MPVPVCRSVLATFWRCKLSERIFFSIYHFWVFFCFCATGTGAQPQATADRAHRSQAPGEAEAGTLEHDSRVTRAVEGGDSSQITHDTPTVRYPPTALRLRGVTNSARQLPTPPTHETQFQAFARFLVINIRFCESGAAAPAGGERNKQRSL